MRRKMVSLGWPTVAVLLMPLVYGHPAHADSIELSDFSPDAITIDFDSLPLGVLTDELAHLGVIFENTQVVARPWAPSHPNQIEPVVGGTPLRAIFVDTLTLEPAVTTRVGMFVDLDDMHPPVSVVAYDEGGALIESVPFTGPGDFAGIEYLCGIGSVEFGPHDGYDDFIFEPVTPATVQAGIDFDPNTLNCRSHGGIVTCYIELPEGYGPGDIQVSTVLLNGSVPALSWPTEVGDHDNDGVQDRMVKFNRGAVMALLPVGEEVEVTVHGELVDCTGFAGSDTIRVRCKNPPRSCLEIVPSGSSRIGASASTIAYDLETQGQVSVRVYHVSGRLVRSLIDRWHGRGVHEVTWNWVADDGHRVGSGVYFVRLEQQGEVSFAKMIVVK